MPTPTLHLDTIRDAEFTNTALEARYTRTGFVSDIDLTDVPDPDALVKVLAVTDFPAMHSSLSSAVPQLRLIGVRVRPELLLKGRRANLELTYSTNVATGTPTAYLLRDKTYTVQKNTCFIPGLRKPIVTSFESPTGAVGLSVPPDMIFFNLDTSARAIQLTVLQYGRPDGGTQNYVNHVNDANWPTGDAQFNQFQFVTASTPLKTATALPKGYWRLISYSTEYNRNAGMTLVQSEAATQVIEDWSVVGMLQDKRTGLYPFAGMSDSDKDAAYTDMMAPAYSHTPYIYPTGTQPKRGLVRTGPYPMTDFHALFNFVLVLLLSLSLVFQP